MKKTLALAVNPGLGFSMGSKDPLWAINAASSSPLLFSLVVFFVLQELTIVSLLAFKLDFNEGKREGKHKKVPQMQHISFSASKISYNHSNAQNHMFN